MKFVLFVLVCFVFVIALGASSATGGQQLPFLGILGGVAEFLSGVLGGSDGASLPTGGILKLASDLFIGACVLLFVAVVWTGVRGK